MGGRKFELTEDTLSVIEEIGGHMPGGFFIYRAEGAEELIYANKPVFDIFGCADLEEFRALTGFTFKGMVYPEDYDRNTGSSGRTGKSDGWTITVITVKQKPTAAFMWYSFRTSRKSGKNVRRTKRPATLSFWR